MEEYKIYLYTKNKITVEQIKNTIFFLTQLGYFIKYKGEYFNIEEALEFLLSKKGSIKFIKNYNDYFYGFIANKEFCLYTSFLRSNILIEFKHGMDPNTISLLRFFLCLTESFLLEKISLSTDLDLFYNLELALSDKYSSEIEFSISEKKQAKDPNAIHAYVLIHRKEYISDALTLVNSAAKYCYKFIDNPQSRKMLELNEAHSEISKAMNQGESTVRYLLIDNFIMKLAFNNELISLYPIEPFKMKTVDNEIGIDIKFYLTIYLNLVEEFGIDDLITTFDD